MSSDNPWNRGPQTGRPCSKYALFGLLAVLTVAGLLTAGAYLVTAVH